MEKQPKIGRVGSFNNQPPKEAPNNGDRRYSPSAPHPSNTKSELAGPPKMDENGNPIYHTNADSPVHSEATALPKGAAQPMKQVGDSQEDKKVSDVSKTSKKSKTDDKS